MNYQIIPRLVESTKVQVVSISCNEVPQCDSYIAMDGTILEELVIPMMVSEYGWTKYRKVTQLAVLFRPKLVLINKFTNETGNKIDILNRS